MNASASAGEWSDVVYRVIGQSPVALLPHEILAHPEVRLTGPRLAAILRALVAARSVETCLVVVRGKDETGYHVGPLCVRPTEERGDAAPAQD